MAAITWRNVDAPNLLGVSQMMRVGQQGINDGLDGIGDVLKKQQEVEAANWQTQKTNNTNNLYNKLMGFTTPEEYQAGAAGLQQEMSGMGAQVDQAAFRQALDKRLPELQQRSVQGQQYKDQQLDVQSRPIVDRLSTMAMSEDKDLRTSAKAALLQYQNEGLIRNPAELAAKIDRADYTFTERGRETEKFGFDKEAEKRKAAMHPLDLAAKRADISYKGALTNKENAAANKENAALNSEGKGGSKQSAAALEALVKGSVMSAGVIGTKDGDASVMEWITKNLSGAEKNDAIYNFNKRKSEGVVVGKDENGKPIKAPIPAQIMINALGSSSENPLAMLVPGWSRRGDDADNLLTKLMQDPTLLREIHGVTQAQGNDMYPGLIAAADKAERAVMKHSLSTSGAGGAILPPSALVNNQRIKATTFDDNEGAPNPNINNLGWMEEQRNRAKAKNSRLSESVKPRLNITE